MASYPLPRKLDRLLTLAYRVFQGLQTHGDAIGASKQAMFALASELKAAQDAEKALRDERRRRKTEFLPAQEKVDLVAKGFFTPVRRVLRNRLGRRWSRLWKEAGWTSKARRTPGSVRGREALLGKLASYFQTHPQYEDPSLGVTAKRAWEHHAALVAARIELERHEARVKHLSKVQNAAMRILRKRLRAIVADLEGLLEPDDVRWRLFGLSAPADPPTPDLPEILRLRPVLLENGIGEIHVEWSDARRADFYDVFRKIKGFDASFVLVRRISDTGLVLSNLPQGAEVAVRVVARNWAGSSLAVEGEVALAGVKASTAQD